MKRLATLALVPFVLALGFFLTTSLIRYAEAQGADEVAQLDAGVVAAPAPAETVDEAAVLPTADDPLAGASMIWKMWKAGALIPAVILTAFLLVLVLLKYVPSLNKGRTGIILTAGLASAGILVERAAAGSTPNAEMIISAVLGWALLVVKAEFPGAVPKAG